MPGEPQSMDSEKGKEGMLGRGWWQVAEGSASEVSERDLGACDGPGGGGCL